MYSRFDGHLLCSPFFPYYATTDDYGEMYCLSNEARRARHDFWYEPALH